MSIESSEAVAAAQRLLRADLPPIPLQPGTRQPSVDPAAWYSALSDDTINRHWQEHPNDGVGWLIEADALAVCTRTSAGNDAISALAVKHSISPVLTTLGKGGAIWHFKQSPEHSDQAYMFSEHLYVIPCGTLISQGNKVHCMVDDTADQSAGVTIEFIEDLTALMAQQPSPSPNDQLVSESRIAAAEPELPAKNIDRSHPLACHSMTGKSEELAKRVQAQVPIIGKTALMGQASVYYAAPNTGKTLLIMKELVSSIQAGRVEAGKVFYFNMDDNGQGLLTKIRIAEQYNFHMVADGYADFNSAAFLDTILKLLDTAHCEGILLVLDTVKKVTDIMDKRAVAEFTRVMRRFVMKGGTVIALAHTNKHPRPDGSPVYAGTTDLRDDFDCAYTMQELPMDPGTKSKYVELRNIKRRGNVAEQVVYTYTPSGDYLALLDSVHAMSEKAMAEVQRQAQLARDADLIEMIRDAIQTGTNLRMKLAAKVRLDAQVSRAEVLRVLDTYTGINPVLHRWTVHTGDRGAKQYSLP